MLESIIYIFPVLLFLIGLVLFFVGKEKKNNKLMGIGIVFLVCLIILESLDFIQGFIKGWANG